MIDLAPWLCWIMPTIGSIAHYLLPKRIGRKRYIVTIGFTFIAFIMATTMLPLLPIHGYKEIGGIWFSLPDGNYVEFAILIDNLSIILTNLVAFLSLLILIYSYKYMEGEPGEDRYWFFMSLFVGGMLILILANNFIFFFIGWKIVGLCSFALISHYYSDERKYWIGGPEPYPFQKPSRCGLKALFVTTLGDVALLASIIIIYLYSGTFSFMELYKSVNIWMSEIAKTPGLLTITILLFLSGPFSKSAQFPFHEWLPEAMSGPTPVSALIHAATMVKAGVYLVARVLPIFYFGTWILGIKEAYNFFLIVAIIGGFTAFLAATQAMVAIELKKVLAYSTMSVIGYMMLGLGIAGISSETLIEGFTSSIFHLINHGIFKAALFLCAGVLIHASGSIYITDMKLSSKTMKFTWIFMWISSLALIGIPPLSGFWSKEGILSSCYISGQYWIFILSVLTVAVTSFYVIRLMGITFHSPNENNSNKHHEHGEASKIMLIPYGILAILTVIIGIVGPWINNMLYEFFAKEFYDIHLLEFHTLYIAHESIIPTILSIVMIVIGGLPAYYVYIANKLSSINIIERYGILKAFHKFLWNRWYIDSAFNKIFAYPILASREPVAKYIEAGMDYGLNMGIPKLFEFINNNVRKLQTGVLSINMIYIMIFAVFLMFIFIIFGVI